MASHKVRQVFSLRSPDSHMPPLVSSFDTTRSRSTLAWSSSAQMTTVHPIPGSSHLHHSHPAPPAFRSRLAAFLLFFLHEITDALDTPNVRSLPLKLLRSSEALNISSLLSSGYACGVGFSRLCLLHALQLYFCFPLGACPFRFNASLPQCGQ